MNLGIKSDESGILSQIVWISTLLNLDLLIRGPPKITHIHMHAYSTLHYITSHHITFIYLYLYIYIFIPFFDSPVLVDFPLGQ